MITYEMSRKQIEDIGQLGATGLDSAKILNDFVLYTDKNEKSVGQWLANYGFWESWITSWMTRNIKPGDVCVDIGANYGYYTRIMERLATRSGLVYAFEPNPSLCRGIENSIKDYPMYDGAEIKIYDIAVADTNGLLTLYIPPLFIGGSTIIEDKSLLPSRIASENWTETIEVKASRLDDVLGFIEHVNIIKIDIEGAEAIAWKGMQSIIEKTDVIIIELSQELPKDFIDELFNKFSISFVDYDSYEKPITRKDFDDFDELIMAVLRKK
jgi:FkbM family methyltransferase